MKSIGPLARFCFLATSQPTGKCKAWSLSSSSDTVPKKKVSPSMLPAASATAGPGPGVALQVAGDVGCGGIPGNCEEQADQEQDQRGPPLVGAFRALHRLVEPALQPGLVVGFGLALLAVEYEWARTAPRLTGRC